MPRPASVASTSTPSPREPTQEDFAFLAKAALSARVPPQTATCGFDVVVPSWGIGPRTLTEHLLYFLLDGGIRVEAAGAPFELGPLSLLWLGPGTHHRLMLNPPLAVPRLYWFRIILPVRSPCAGCVLVRHQVPELRAACASFYQAVNSDDQMRDLRLRSSLGMLLVQVAQAAQEQPDGPAMLSTVHLARMRTALEASWECFTPARLAHATGLAPRYFTRRFTATFGASPRVWLVRERLRRAAQTLIESRGSISAIALNSGFSDPFRFSRAFKELYGVSPRQWRNEKGR